MKQWIEKQKYKIAIAICSILSIFTLFLGINKTYAYSTNQFSYTLSSETQTTTITYNNVEYNGILMSYGNNYYFNLNESESINIYSHTILFNYFILDYNNNVYYNTSNTSRSYYRSLWFNTNILVSYMYNRSSYRGDEPYFTTAINTNSTTSTSIINQRFYANLGEQYNGFDNSYKLFIINFDIVKNSEVGLSQYYDTYYSQLEQNYLNLQSDFIDLQDDYDTLETNYNTLESNYNTLEDSYTNLLNNVNSMSNMGIMQFINKIDFTYYLNGGLGYYEKTMSLLEVMESNYFSGTFFDIQQFASDWAQELNISTNNELVVEIDFIPIDIDLFSFRTEEMEVIDYRNISLTNDINNVNVVLNTNPIINQQQIENVYGSTLENYKIKSLYIEYSTMGSDIYNHSFFGSDISITQVAYNRGFNMAKQQYESLILELNNRITANNQLIQQLQSELEFSTTSNRDLNTQIDNLETENTRFRYVIASLEAQLRSYQEGSNDYNLNRMIWTIASTPFESFKQIWNVNFFGVNISTMITGFITGIIVLWIIKKFFL